MRVCWFTNAPFPAALRAGGRPARKRGGWLSSFGEALVGTGEVELLVVTFVRGANDQRVRAGACDHALLAVSPLRYWREWCSCPSASLREKCRRIVAEFKPDVVHISGTEGSYGLLLAEGDIEGPGVVLLQGTLKAVGRHFCGDLSFADRLRSLSISDMIRRNGPATVRRAVLRRAERNEQRILRTDAIFTGRTRFDEAYLRCVNPSAVYCHCDEILRAPFYSTERDAERVVPYSIFTGGGGYPLKGIHCLVEAVALVRKEYPDITLRMPGRPPSSSWIETGYQRYLHRLIRSLGLENRVVSLGKVTADNMAKELARAHLFALPSFADNSSNTLAEAMMEGLSA